MSNWKEVVELEGIPSMGSRVVEAGDIQIAIFRTSDDQVFAIRNACPHKGGPLSEGIVHGTSVTCPLHNWKIDLASGKALGPDEGCANVFPAKVEDGKVYLSLGG
ncbi:MAG: nitrite reductase small subunit NirD [Gammaproteobacteria bacterium]|nr:nitrite reductase small subunit NirD [Gammaproteobacteria bacterium]